MENLHHDNFTIQTFHDVSRTEPKLRPWKKKLLTQCASLGFFHSMSKYNRCFFHQFMVQHPIAIPNQRGEFQIRNVLPKLSNLRHVKLLLFHSNGSHEGHILWRILIQCHFPFILIVMWDNVGNVLVMFGNNPKWQKFFGYALIDWNNWLIDTSPELHSHALITPYFFSRWTMLSIFPHWLFSPYSHIISSRSSIPEISCE